MRRGTVQFLQVVLVLLGVGALALLLWEPHLEGRNAHATLFAIYFNDPFLAYAYLASLPFFVGLYRAFQVLGQVGANHGFSPASVKGLRTIKHCALAIIALVALGECLLLLSPSDDRAGGVFIGVLITLASMVVATAMAILERTIQNAERREVSA